MRARGGPLRGERTGTGGSLAASLSLPRSYWRGAWRGCARGWRRLRRARWVRARRGRGGPRSGAGPGAGEDAGAACGGLFGGGGGDESQWRRGQDAPPPPAAGTVRRAATEKRANAARRPPRPAGEPCEGRQPRRSPTRLQAAPRGPEGCARSSPPFPPLPEAWPDPSGTLRGAPPLSTRGRRDFAVFVFWGFLMVAVRLPPLPSLPVPDARERRVRPGCSTGHRDRAGSTLVGNEVGVSRPQPPGAAGGSLRGAPNPPASPGAPGSLLPPLAPK
ncbi:collagen alpha-1(I) chain-like [Acinonyx jubatus]|uniref:Collagen alpha-1(I) chain-like n=1 Tax=Acinonyx jubatus TaxID=32536 RepID=A0ABM3PKC6_ACIJB|nr:collagen alpha-1(I) chain-like [Acinonyx jubatus]